MTKSGLPLPPLLRLAFRILSVCPNSASCERLFSSFGLILTKLRSRLSNGKLLDLAELKMHLRDERIRNTVKEELRKRAFGLFGKTGSQKRSTPGTSRGPSPPPTNEPSSSSTPIPSTSGSGNLPPPPLFLPPEESTFAPWNDRAEQTQVYASQTLRETVDGFEGQILDDEDAELLLWSPSAASGNNRYTLMALFGGTHNPDNWVDELISHGIAQLDEEREIYELLDLDAPGEEFNVDNSLFLD